MIHRGCWLGLVMFTSLCGGTSGRRVNCYVKMLINPHPPKIISRIIKISRLQDPQGLAGTITYPIVYWRAFFLLFHHFMDKIYVYFGDLSL